MTYQVRPAQRAQAKPLIGIYSTSGCGKTLSSLLLARGYAGKDGKIVMIETESGRGEAYADPSEYPEVGGYDVISMRDNFSPAEYGKAITAAEQANPAVLVIDSASHEWEGAGGVLSMAAANEAAGKRGQIVWQKPKMSHQQDFMLRFMQTSIPLVILNMRAKYPMEQVPDPRNSNKKIWQRSNDLTPKQSEDILFEMFVHGWIDTDHNFHMTKCTAKGLEEVFGGVRPLSNQSGEMLRQWASGEQKPAGVPITDADYHSWISKMDEATNPEELKGVGVQLSHVSDAYDNSSKERLNQYYKDCMATLRGSQQ